MTVAAGEPGAWTVAAPIPVGDPATLLARLATLAGPDQPVALGVDFPIGLPRAFAARHVVTADFPAFLRTLAADDAFFDVCATTAELSGARPFYPARGLAGMTRLSHAAALGLPDAAALSRQCDRATPLRPAGAPLFWTLGANQTGKAAIAAWRDMLLPALTANFPIALWPFAGAFHDLLRPGRVVVAETYPAEAMRQLGLRMNGSKRRQADRTALGPTLRARMAAHGLQPDEAMALAVEQGFGADACGEDRFDSLLGLLCVVAVCDRTRDAPVPDDPWVSAWEGWVLGQSLR